MEREKRPVVGPVGLWAAGIVEGIPDVVWAPYAKLICWTVAVSCCCWESGSSGNAGGGVGVRVGDERRG